MDKKEKQTTNNTNSIDKVSSTLIKEELIKKWEEIFGMLPKEALDDDDIDRE